jgi:hypothetical protein
MSIRSICHKENDDQLKFTTIAHVRNTHATKNIQRTPKAIAANCEHKYTIKLGSESKLENGPLRTSRRACELLLLSANNL